MTGFTLVCDRCGEKQNLKNYRNEYFQASKNIDVKTEELYNRLGDVEQAIDIRCKNPKCKNYLSI